MKLADFFLLKIVLKDEATNLRKILKCSYRYFYLYK